MIRSEHRRGAKLVKDAKKKTFFLDGIKKLTKSWNRCFEIEGITLKSNIRFVFVYLQ
jgi:hypothetical protein